MRKEKINMVKKDRRNKKLIIIKVLENNPNFIYFKKSNLTYNYFKTGKAGRSWTSCKKYFRKLS